MIRPFPTSEDAKNKSLLLCVFALVYLLVFLPFAYFRNDDWWILGNGVLHLPQNWSFAFSPTLFVNGIEQTWFFRPFFKIFTFLFFKVFGFNYYLWLSATLLFTVGALSFASRAIELVTGSAQSAFAFLLIFIASIHLHFGSIMWMGEGLMNCPQIFLLISSLFFFCDGYFGAGNRGASFVIALVLYVLSLGFKESAVFHPVFLTALVLSEKRFQKTSLKARALTLIPYAILTASYLVYRLCYLPINSGYIPKFTHQDFGESSLILVASMAFPLVTLIAIAFTEGKQSGFNYLKSLKQKWWYLPFFAVVISPYIGHPFFSPGWLFSPGIYFAVFLAFSIPSTRLSKKFFLLLGTALLTVSLPPILWRLNTTGWWSWHKPQRQIIEIFQSNLAAQIEGVAIYDCENPAFPTATLSRVVGTPYGLFEAWRMNHVKAVPIDFKYCQEMPKEILAGSTTLHIQWRFPEFTVLNR